jgi:hypothetical protein
VERCLGGTKYSHRETLGAMCRTQYYCVLLKLGVDNDVRTLPTKEAIATQLEHIRQALLDNPEEAAMIRNNVRELREYFARKDREAA